jgi:hypothetical protein
MGSDETLWGQQHRPTYEIYRKGLMSMGSEGEGL